MFQALESDDRLFLSEGVLTRPFVQLEIGVALEAKKRVLFEMCSFSLATTVSGKLLQLSRQCATVEVEGSPFSDTL